MSKKLIIIGAGNIEGFIANQVKDFEDYYLIGFLDADTKMHSKKYYGERVIGGLDVIGFYG